MCGILHRHYDLHYTASSLFSALYTIVTMLYTILYSLSALKYTVSSVNLAPGSIGIFVHHVLTIPVLNTLYQRIDLYFIS